VYSDRLSQEHIAKACTKRGWTPDIRPASEVRQRAAEIHALAEENGKLRRPLTDEEILWIRQERLYCTLWWRYWAERYCKIMAMEGGSLVYLVPNIAQNILLDTWAEDEERGVATEQQSDKARQLGVSTIVLSAIVHRVQFYKHTTALMAAQDEKKSADLSQIPMRMWLNQPWYLVPENTGYQAGELIEFGKMDSRLRIEWLNQKSDLGRSGTKRLALVSEAAYCDDPKNKIEAGLKFAMHASPGMLKVYESTARMMNDWWHEKWRANVRNWAKGTADERPVFLPWFVGSDLYPTETWLKKHPIPYQWKPNEMTVNHARRATQYVDEQPLLKKHLGAGWQMPVHQMWFWESEYESARENKTLNKFFSEMPASAEQSFQHANDSIFDTETIEVYREHARAPLGVYGLIGKTDEIPLRLQANRRDVDAERKPFEVKTESGARYTMLPLKFRGYDFDDPMGRIYIWEWPNKNYQYGMGVDTGWGVAQDRSALEVLRRAAVDRYPGQVAEFASDSVAASDLTPFAYAIGTFYSPTVSGRRVQAKMVIDVGANGESTQVALRNLGWRHFHQWMRTDRKIIDQSKATRLGVMGVHWFRTMALEFTLKALKDYNIEIDSPWLLGEFSNLEKDTAVRNVQAAYGGFDDRVMALAYAFLSLHYVGHNFLPMFGHRRIEGQQVVVEHEEYSFGQQVRDLLPGSAERRELFGQSPRDPFSV